MSKHIAVLMGGWSAEREVSLRSGTACADALERLGYRVTRIDVGRDIATVLTAAQARRRAQCAARPAGRGRHAAGHAGDPRHPLHPFRRAGVGARHAEGRRQGSCSRAAGVPVPEGMVVSRFEAAKAHLLPPPYVIKPIAEGSSVGVFIVTRGPRPSAAGAHPRGLGLRRAGLVESYIAGKELTCAVMGDKALGVIEIVPTVRFYDYEAKYAPGGSKHLLPAPVSPIVYQEVRRLALTAHRALGCRGVSRADFRYDDRIEGTGGLVCLEVNTQPGMTETSLVPELAAHAGITFDELVQWMVEDASLNR